MTLINFHSKYKSIFKHDNIPELFTVSDEDGFTTDIPRATHHHDDRVEISLIIEGEAHYVIDEVEYHTKKGDIIIYNSYTTHEEQPIEGIHLHKYSCGIGNFQIKGLDKNCLLPKNAKNIIPSEDHFDELSGLMSLIYKQVKSEYIDYAESVNYLARSLLLLILHIIHAHKHETDESIFEDGELSCRIKQHIDDHYLEQMSLESIAAALHISPYYVAHVYKNAFGHSPMQYIIKRRIGEAQTYLIQTNLSIIEISNIVGFNNTNHFNNMFHKIVGLSPGTFRKAMLKLQ
ncbi:MAG: AraC family transcriptional regulator [Clostridiales Family XIII bacterium]|jgi:AraC-like DNA-binding protein/mannose-6-phosphate isomerase-like protein (cupin superfamily)|nr:AraC family transcriptional regulator [Clostridiales Family XIII bacterium]